MVQCKLTNVFFEAIINSCNWVTVLLNHFIVHVNKILLFLTFENLTSIHIIMI